MMIDAARADDLGAARPTRFRVGLCAATVQWGLTRRFRASALPSGPLYEITRAVR
jgi:hypothetical protein